MTRDGLPQCTRRWWSLSCLQLCRCPQPQGQLRHVMKGQSKHYSIQPKQPKTLQYTSHPKMADTIVSTCLGHVLLGESLLCTTQEGKMQKCMLPRSVEYRWPHPLIDMVVAREFTLFFVIVQHVLSSGFDRRPDDNSWHCTSMGRFENAYELVFFLIFTSQ